MAIRELLELLVKDPVGTHVINSPALKDDISKLEQSLGRSLPKSFCKFLSYTNGAILFGSELIMGAGDDSNSDIPLIISFWYDLKRLHSDLADKLIPFSPSDGGAYCFLTNKGLDDDEYPVVFWENSNISDITHETFDEWLFELTESLRDMAADFN